MECVSVCLFALCSKKSPSVISIKECYLEAGIGPKLNSNTADNGNRRRKVIIIGFEVRNGFWSCQSVSFLSAQLH